MSLSTVMASVRRVARLTAAAGAVMTSAAGVARAQEGFMPLAQAQEALQRHQLVAAESLLALARQDADARVRASAERSTALASWRFRHDFDDAQRHLELALATGADSARTLVDLARLSIARRRFRDAAGYTGEAARVGRADDVRRLAARRLAEATVEAWLLERVDGSPPAAEQRLDDAAARAAVAALLPFVTAVQGRAEESRFLLEAALLAGDGPAALAGWQSYYAVGAGDTLRGLLARPRRELAALLPGWAGRDASRGDRERLVRALADSRLFDAAAIVALDPAARDRRALLATPRVREIVAYDRFCRRLTREMDEYYRRTLLGERHGSEPTRLLYHAAHDLWPSLAPTHGAVPRYYPAAIDSALAARFGTVIRLGETAGYSDLHMGHRVVDEARTVVQYGRRASLRFVALDGMVSNGFQSWAWDGDGAHGGWQSGSTIIQVRPVFAEGTVAVWLAASDSMRRGAERRLITADSVADWARAATDSIAYLPGVAARLARDGRQELLDSLRRAGYTGAQLQARFIAEAAALARESSIFAHEGRHAIDASDGTWAMDELEFRAKLSEIAFASHPKLSLGAIFHPNIGDRTPHGRANARIMLGLLRWMRAHGDEVAGLDPTRPMLPQIPLLSDEQFRRAFRSMDPMGRPSAAAAAGDR